MSEVIEFSEVLTAGPAHALAGLLGVDYPDSGLLPPLWHMIYLLDRPAQADLGSDGHRRTGGVVAPPEPGTRRMIAGGRVSTRARLRIGEEAQRRSRITDSVVKHGRSGRLQFVTVEHELSQDGEVMVVERQDIVYRDASTGSENATALPPTLDTPAAPPPADLNAGDWVVEVDPALLFRFSALTYNAHRIHYDRDYARDVEGYPGLVVHGPLQAIVMAEAARRVRPDLTGPSEFTFSLVAPLMDFQGLVVSTATQDDGTSTEVRDRAGRISARGTLRPLTESVGA